MNHHKAGNTYGLRKTSCLVNEVFAQGDVLLLVDEFIVGHLGSHLGAPQHELLSEVVDAVFRVLVLLSAVEYDCCMILLHATRPACDRENVQGDFKSLWINGNSQSGPLRRRRWQRLLRSVEWGLTRHEAAAAAAVLLLQLVRQAGRQALCSKRARLHNSEAQAILWIGEEVWLVGDGLVDVLHRWALLAFVGIGPNTGPDFVAHSRACTKRFDQRRLDVISILLLLV